MKGKEGRRRGREGEKERRREGEVPVCILDTTVGRSDSAGDIMEKMNDILQLPLLKDRGEESGWASRCCNDLSWE